MTTKKRTVVAAIVLRIGGVRPIRQRFNGHKIGSTTASSIFWSVKIGQV